MQNNKKFNKNVITIPKYYLGFDQIKYNDSLLAINSFHYNRGNARDYRDSLYSNFIITNDYFPGSFTYESQGYRNDYFNVGTEFSSIIEDNYEIYQSSGICDGFYGSPKCITTSFIIKKDSTSFYIKYLTLDNDSLKLRDYYDLVHNIKISLDSL